MGQPEYGLVKLGMGHSCLSIQKFSLDLVSTFVPSPWSSILRSICQGGLIKMASIILPMRKQLLYIMHGLNASGTLANSTYEWLGRGALENNLAESGRQFELVRS